MLVLKLVNATQKIHNASQKLALSSLDTKQQRHDKLRRIAHENARNRRIEAEEAIEYSLRMTREADARHADGTAKNLAARNVVNGQGSQ